MLLVYLLENSLRSQYVFDLIFREEWEIEYAVTSDVAAFTDYGEEKINYSHARISNEFFIKASALLFDNQIKEQEIKVEQKHQTKVLFPNEEDDSGFDIFSAVFYLVSRYEEYLPFTADKFGRYKAMDSLAFQNNFLQIPIVNIWIHILKDLLQKKFPSLRIKSTVFKAILTYDIDVAFKFLGRNFIRTSGSVLKDIVALKTKNIKERILTLSGSKKDPWDIYDDLKKIILKNKLQTVFFFLLSDRTQYDHNLDYQNPLMKELVNKIKTFSEIGIHPSFYSSSFPEKILIEKERLEKLSGKEIIKSRQHYLKFNLPSTYNVLLKAGISEDYSMGYPEIPGFRAGTCKPFYFYDLENEKSTDLRIFPITFMEGTLMKNLNPAEGYKKISELLKEVKDINGTFISLWHNHTISETTEYAAWKNVHHQMLEKILVTLNEL